MGSFLLSEAFLPATVVFVFLVPGQLAQILSALRSFLQRVPGARIVSQQYEIAGLERECSGRLECAGNAIFLTT